MKDPIVEQARRAGQAYVDSFKGDFKAVCDDLRRRTEQSAKEGHAVATLSSLRRRRRKLPVVTRSGR